MEQLNNEVLAEVVQEGLEESLVNSVITTLEIAEMMGVSHNDILRKLNGRKGRKGYIQILNESQMVVVDYFIKSSYIDSKGETRPCYLVTKLGCDFLANKFTGEKGVIFTAKYVKRFHQMEDTIKSGELVQVQDLTKQVEVMQVLMKQQQECIKNQQELLQSICEKQSIVEQGNTANRESANPYGASSNDELEERKKEIYRLTAKVAELCNISQTKVLHYMYITMEDRLGLTLDAYKSVYISETGKTDVGMVEVIASNGRLYETAIQMNREIIERKQIYG